MGFFDMLGAFWPDDKEEIEEVLPRKSFKTNISFRDSNNNRVSDKYTVCGITPKYMNIKGEYVKADRLVFLKKKKGDVTILKESQIINSSLNLSTLQFADFQEETRTKNWLTKPNNIVM